MADQPITPTRIIPAGTPLPARPPEPDELPPWRDVPPPSAPPPPPVQPLFYDPPLPGPIEVHVTFLPVEEPPEPSRWERLWTWITGIAAPWKIALTLAAAATPIPGVGHSLGGVWAYTVGEARTETGAAWAYGLALVPLLLSARIVARTRSLRALFALAVCLIGVTGAVHWFDPITALTGVHPR